MRAESIKSGYQQPGQPTPASRSILERMLGSNWFSYVPSIIAILLLWQFSTSVLEVPHFLIPPPMEVAQAMVANYAILAVATLATLREIFGGFIFAMVLSLPIALLTIYSRIFERFVNPLVVISQAVPKVAIAPLFLVWFGFGEFPKMLIAALVAFFPMLVAFTVGLKGIDPEMLSMARSMGATPLRTFMKMRLPIALPSFFGGFKLGVTFSVIGAVIGEFVGGDHGIGYVIQLASGSQRLDLLFAGLLILSSLSLIMYYAVEFLERRFCSWHHSQITATN